MSFLLSPEQHSGPVLGTSAASYPALFIPGGFRSQSHQKPATASSEEECSQAYVTLWWTPLRSGWQANLAIGQRGEWSNGLCMSLCPGNDGFYLAFRHTYHTYSYFSPESLNWLRYTSYRRMILQGFWSSLIRLNTAMLSWIQSIKVWEGIKDFNPVSKWTQAQEAAAKEPVVGCGETLR